MIRERVAQRRDNADDGKEDRSDAVMQELREGLSPFLDRAAGGEHFIISKDDRPVAKPADAEDLNGDRAAAAVRRLRELRDGTTLGGLTWKELRDAGRR